MVINCYRMFLSFFIDPKKQPQNVPIATSQFDDADLITLPQMDLDLIEVAVYETSVSPELKPEASDTSVVASSVTPTVERPGPSVVGSLTTTSLIDKELNVEQTSEENDSPGSSLLSHSHSSKVNGNERLPNVPQSLTNSQQNEIEAEQLENDNSQTSSERSQNQEHFTLREDSKELFELLRMNMSSLVASADWAKTQSKKSKLKRKHANSSEEMATKRAKVSVESRTGLESETDLPGDDVLPYRASPSEQEQSDGESPSRLIDLPRATKAIQQNPYKLRPRDDSSRDSTFVIRPLFQSTTPSTTSPGDGSLVAGMNLRHSQPVNYTESDSLDYESEEIDITDNSFDDFIGEAPSIIIQSDSETDLNEDQDTIVLEVDDRDSLHFAIEHSVNSNKVQSREHTEHRRENEMRGVYPKKRDVSEMVLIPSSDDNMSQSSQTSIVLIGAQPVATQEDNGRVSIAGTSPVGRGGLPVTNEILGSRTANLKGVWVLVWVSACNACMHTR